MNSSLTARILYPEAPHIRVDLVDMPAYILKFVRSDELAKQMLKDLQADVVGFGVTAMLQPLLFALAKRARTGESDVLYAEYRDSL